MASIFPSGIKGIADTKWSGVAGAAARLIGIDFRSKPGVFTAHQKLAKVSGDVVDVLAKVRVRLNDGKRLWFGATKAFLDNAGTWSEKLDLDKFNERDVMFTNPEFGSFGEPSSVVRVSADGFMVYVSSFSTGKLRQYSLSEAFDITSTKTLVAEWSISSVSFWITETRIFILNRDSVDVYLISGGNISTHQLITNWDISAQTTAAQDIGFKADGTAMYVMDTDGDIFEYTIPAWGGVIPTFWELLVGGGASGGGARSYTGSQKIVAGCGGAGNVYESPNAVMEPGTVYNVSVGAGATGAAAGTNNGTDGGDTTGFGKTALGGGHGTAVNSEGSGHQPTNDGGPGGSGGGAGWYDDQGNAFGGAVEAGSSQMGGGTKGGDSGDDGGGGINLSSTISGSAVTYGASQSKRNSNGNGANATGIGQGGQGGASGFNGSAGARSGGNGLAGIAILRFKTTDVPGYSQSGGSVTTSGGDTIITWTTTGTFSYPGPTAPAFADSYSFPTARGFAIESDRISFIVGDTVNQYAMTDYDLDDVTLNPNLLYVDTVDDTVTPRSIQFTEKYLIIGMETGAEDDLTSVIFYEFIGGGEEILSAASFSPTIFQKATSPVVVDSYSLTAVLNNPSSFNEISNNSDPKDFSVRELLDITTSGSPITGAFVRAYQGADPSISTRGYVTAVSSSDVTMVPQDFNPGTYITDAVVEDALIMEASIGAFSGWDAVDTVIQPFTLARDTLIDELSIKYREGFGLAGGYTLTGRIKDDTGTVIATETKTIDSNTIGHTEATITFAFSAVTLQAGVKYTIETFVPSVSSFAWNRTSNRYLVCPVRKQGVFPFPVTTTEGNSEIQARLIDTSIPEVEEDRVPEERVYIATEKMLFYIKASDVAGDWGGKIHTVGSFKNGQVQYHPMAVQNLQLFIGDSEVMAKVNELGQFVQETELNVEGNEIITTTISFDIDLLIGTKNGNKCRIIRWDTVSESWTAEDTIDDTEIYAFIRDDNFVYALVGDAGRFYYYDGEKLVPFQNMPGDFTPTAKAKINANAVGFLLGVPVFGFSQLLGNPADQGVYGLGSYSKDYPKTLSLDFPISPDVLVNIEVGAILTDGSDMWVSWKAGLTPEYGVDKLDWSNKYPNAYLETMMLSPIKNRSNFKTIARVLAPYASLPTGTSVELGYKKNYAATYETFSSVVDAKGRKIKAEKSVPEIGNVQLRLGLGVSGNLAPEIEDFQLDFVAESTQTA